MEMTSARCDVLVTAPHINRGARCDKTLRERRARAIRTVGTERGQERNFVCVRNEALDVAHGSTFGRSGQSGRNDVLAEVVDPGRDDFPRVFEKLQFFDDDNVCVEKGLRRLCICETGRVQVRVDADGVVRGHGSTLCVADIERVVDNKHVFIDRPQTTDAPNQFGRLAGKHGPENELQGHTRLFPFTM